MTIEYKTERGVTIGIVPIPFLIDRIRQKARETEPKRPSYTEHLAGGATQEREITAQMATLWSKENPESWAEHAETWTQYAVAWSEWDSGVDDQIWSAICLESVQVELPADDAWMRRQKRYYGLDVPDDPDERYIHYVVTEVMGGPRDYMRVTSIANGGDIGEDALAIAEASFRGVLQGALNRELHDLQRRGALDDEPANGGNEGSAAVGQDADRVLGAE